MATFGLIHGAWHGAWCWSRLIPELRALGHAARAMDLPCDDPDADFGDYVDAVVDALAGAGEPVIAVGHSLAGVVLPLVAARLALARQVYLCSILHPGLLPSGASGPHAPGTFAALERFPDRSHRWPSADAVRPVLYGDVDEELVAWCFPRLRRQHTARPWAAVPEPEPWPASPVSAIVCAEDRAVVPAWGTWAARTVLGVEPIVLPGGHSPFLSRPAELARALAALAAPGAAIAAPGWPAG